MIQLCDVLTPAASRMAGLSISAAGDSDMKQSQRNENPQPYPNSTRLPSFDTDRGTENGTRYLERKCVVCVDNIYAWNVLCVFVLTNIFCIPRHVPSICFGLDDPPDQHYIYLLFKGSNQPFCSGDIRLEVKKQTFCRSFFLKSCKFNFYCISSSDCCTVLREILWYISVFSSKLCFVHYISSVRIAPGVWCVLSGSVFTVGCR